MKYVIFMLLLGCSTFPPCKDVPKEDKQQCLDDHYERMDRINDRLDRFDRGGLR